MVNTSLTAINPSKNALIHEYRELKDKNHSHPKYVLKEEQVQGFMRKTYSKSSTML